MSESEAKPGSERRTEHRHFACFPAHIERPGGSTRMALIRDLSVTGALLYTREKLAVGDEIKLNLYLDEDMDKVRPVTAHVVRVEPREGERAEVWHHSTAVHFTESLEDCQAAIEAIEAHQEKVGVPRD